MRKDEHKRGEPKGIYRVRNWAAYNAGLIARGDVTMWIDRSVLKQEPEVGDADVLPELLDQIPTDTPVDTIGGDGAYDTKQCHTAIAARGAQTSIPPREGAMPWPQTTSGAVWRNEAIDAITRSGRREWKTSSGYHRRSLVENLMYRLKTLTGNRL